MVFAAILLVSLLALSLLRHIMLNLRELDGCLEALANLDMRRSAHVVSRDEFGDLLGQYNRTIQKLQGVVTNTKESAETVSATSSELSATMDSIATAAEEQSAMLTEIATAVEETSTSAAAVLDRTKSSVETTSHVSSQLNDAALSLRNLQEATAGIEDARDVIQGISEQINLLALNAAIEAARAGDTGRGFAVVADEVRKFATSAGASIEQITTRISSLVDAVNRTSSGLESSNSLMQTLQDNAGMMIGTVNEQTAAIEQISRSVHEFRAQMEDITRSVHETKVASSDLSDIANELSSTAAQFTT